MNRQTTNRASQASSDYSNNTGEGRAIGGILYHGKELSFSMGRLKTGGSTRIKEQ